MKLLSLVRRELNAQVWSVKFSVLTLTALLLAALSVNMGRSELVARQRASQQLLDQRASDRAKDGRLLGSSTEVALRAVRVPNQLSALVRGVDDILPAYWDFSPAGVRQGPPGVIQEATPEIGTRLDLQFLIAVVLGLLALLCGLDAVLVDRENGTLHALLSQPVPSWAILAGKAAGGMAALLLSLASILLCTFIASRAWLPALSRMDLLAFLTSTLVVGLLYLGALFSGGLLLATLFRTNRVAQSLSLVLWFYATIVAPSLIPVIGRVLTDAPSRQSVENQLQSVYAAGFRQLQESTGAAIGPYRPGERKSVQDATAQHVDRRLSSGLLRLRLQLTALEQDAAGKIQRQRRTVTWLSAISPTSQVEESLSALAGTGSLLRTRWERAASQYQQQLNAQLFDNRPRVTLLIPNGQGSALVGLDLRTPKRAADVADFQPPASSLRQGVLDALPQMAVLSAYSAVLLALAFVAFSRSAI